MLDNRSLRGLTLCFREGCSILRGPYTIGGISRRAAPSSRGLGHRLFTPATRVRIPLGSFFAVEWSIPQSSTSPITSADQHSSAMDPRMKTIRLK